MLSELLESLQGEKNLTRKKEAIEQTPYAIEIFLWKITKWVIKTYPELICVA